MNIEFTLEQFERLLKAVYLGNWLANSIHDGSREDPFDEELEGIEDYVFSLAKDFGLEKLIEYDKEHKRYFPTNKFDDLMQEYIEDYDEDCFWDELFWRMSERDFNRAYAEDEVSKMELKEIFEKEEPFRQKWDNEIDTYGLNRLEVQER